MAAMVSASAGAENDWKDDIKRPEKDTRVQTAVSN